MEGDFTKSDPESHIGNLTILDKDTNNQISSWNFAKKRQALTKSLLRDECFSEWLSDETKSEITHEDILVRGESLRDIALSRVWEI